MRSIVVPVCPGWLRRSCRVLLGVVLWVAAVSKLANLGAFVDVVLEHRVLSYALVWPAVWCLVLVELVLGGLLVAGAYEKAALAASLCLLALFTLEVSLQVLRGNPVPCGCFGGDSPVSWLTVLRQLGLMGMTLWLLTPFLGQAGRRRIGSPGRELGC